MDQNLIVIGISGVGKSFSMEWIEENYRACRVRRFTTRPLRRGEDPKLVVAGQSLPSGSEVFYYGRGLTRYCILGSDIEAIRASHEVPLIELGKPETAFQCRERFSPALIIWLRRDVSRDCMKSLLNQRQVDPARQRVRLRTFAEDLESLKEHACAYDYQLSNIGTEGELFQLWRTLLQEIDVLPR